MIYDEFTTFWSLPRPIRRMPLKDTAYPAPEDHLDTYEDQYGVLTSTIRRIKIQRISFKTLYSILRMHIPNTPYSRSDQDSRRNKDIERGPYSKSTSIRRID